jgi:hypothetical protein
MSGVPQGVLADAAVSAAKSLGRLRLVTSTATVVLVAFSVLIAPRYAAGVAAQREFAEAGRTLNDSVETAERIADAARALEAEVASIVAQENAALVAALVASFRSLQGEIDAIKRFHAESTHRLEGLDKLDPDPADPLLIDPEEMRAQSAQLSPMAQMAQSLEPMDSWPEDGATPPVDTDTQRAIARAETRDELLAAIDPWVRENLTGPLIERTERRVADRLDGAIRAFLSGVDDASLDRGTEPGRALGEAIDDLVSLSAARVVSMDAIQDVALPPGGMPWWGSVSGKEAAVQGQGESIRERIADRRLVELSGRFAGDVERLLERNEARLAAVRAEIERANEAFEEAKEVLARLSSYFSIIPVSLGEAVVAMPVLIGAWCGLVPLLHRRARGRLDAALACVQSPGPEDGGDAAAWNAVARVYAGESPADRRGARAEPVRLVAATLWVLAAAALIGAMGIRPWWVAALLGGVGVMATLAPSAGGGRGTAPGPHAGLRASDDLAR